MRAKITEEGLLIPREVAERLGSKEVEILEEPGRLLVVAGDAASGDRAGGSSPGDDPVDPISGLGRNPVDTGSHDGSVDHDRYLYGA